MQITSKGQVTIPKIFRDKFGLLPNTPVEFAVRGNKLVIEKSKPKRRSKKLSLGAEMVRHMTGRGKWPAKSTDEIMELLRGE